MKYTSTILAALMMAALPAFAGPAPKAPVLPPVVEEPTFSYNFVEAGWTHLDFDDGLGNSDGYRLHGSYSPVQSIFVFAGWGQDFGDTIDRNLAEAGVGVYIPLVSRVHWVTTAGAGWVDTRNAGNNDDDWAFNGSTGLRIRMCPKSELEVAYEISVGDDTDHGASVGVLYNVTTQVQLVARGNWSDDEIGFGVGVRYNF